MRPPRLPANEQQRLQRLHSLGVLDTPPDERLDGLTRIASMVLGVPIALVSLVDTSRQWFKARVGLDVAQTPRDVSFCGHVVETGEALVVPDTALDERFADNPLVTGDPRIRFYAGAPLRTSDDQVLGTLCVIDRQPRQLTDVQLETLRLLAAQAVELIETRAELLRAETDRRWLEAVFEGMAEGVGVMDSTARVITANAAAPGLLGMTMDQLLGRNASQTQWNLLHEDGTPWPVESHPAFVALTTRRAVRNQVMGVQRADGSRGWLTVNAVPTEVRGETHVVVTLSDVTPLFQLKDRERLLARQEHLVTTGTLAAGVGHEINNPLAFMVSNLDYCIEELNTIGGGSPSGRVRELVNVLLETREGAERIKKIVRGLRAFARQENALGPVDVGRAIKMSMNMAQHEFRNRATLVLSTLPLDCPPAIADESRLLQVLVNLLVNAAQAFPDGDLEKNRVSIGFSRVGPVVRVHVRDTGPGVPPELHERVFDPFFTTKPPGKGTGLGLSISRSLATAMGGRLVLEPSSAGASFCLELQVSEEGVLSTAGTGGEGGMGRRGRVLIVDDEPHVLGSVRRVLGREHDVFTEHDPRRALARFERGERFELVLCDLTMPWLNGAQLYEAVRRLDEAAARSFVFITGGANDELSAFLSHAPNERLDKPFETAALREVARRFVGS